MRRLAARNPRCIYLCARSASKAQALISDIHTQYPSAIIKPVSLELSSLQSAKSAAATITESTDRLDILFLHAGVSVTAPALTKDGYEWQFGVNYVAHAYFAQRLMPLLLQTAKAGGDVRIVHTASEAAKAFAPKGGLVLSDSKTDMAGYSGTERYGQSKLANILFAKKLAQLYPSLTSTALHPGLVRSENYSKGDGAGWFKPLWRIMLLLTGVSVEEGAKGQLWAATAPNVRSGQFYMPGAKEDDGGKYGNDQSKIDELWLWTEKEIAAHGGGDWPNA